MQQHVPVLIDSVVSLMAPQAGEHYLDLTAGYGGHARRVLDHLREDGQAVLVDRDQNAVEHVAQAYKGDRRVEVIHDDYLSASQRLHAEGRKFDLILADIGLSSPHIDNASRGFSFAKEGPLDMRMDQRQSITAADLVNTTSKEELVEILRKYGEVRGAERIVEAIIDSRPVQTTTELANIVNNSTRGYPKVRLEAQVFQALRVAVNGELEQLSRSLPLWHSMLEEGGRLAVISFHSLEDRIVKQYFAEHGGKGYDADLVILTKQPITSTAEESFSNPRARSAKLRVAQRK